MNPALRNYRGQSMPGSFYLWKNNRLDPLRPSGLSPYGPRCFAPVPPFLYPRVWRGRTRHATGEETLQSPLRVGRRAGVTVLVTEGGAVLEVQGDGSLRIGDSPYERRP